MKFAPSTEQFTDESFMAYLGVLTTSDAIAEWDNMMREIEGGTPDGGSAHVDLLIGDMADNGPADGDPSERNPLRRQPAILGAVALQCIGQFNEVVDEVTGGTALTVQGTTAGDSFTHELGMCYGTTARVAARSRDVRYPHITLSRKALGVSDAQVLHQTAEVESFTLPLVIVGKEDYPSAAVMQGALSTLMRSNWRYPNPRKVWPPTQPPVRQ